MNLQALAFPGILFFSFLFFNWNFVDHDEKSRFESDRTVACEMELGEDVQLALGDSFQIESQFSCQLTEIESFAWAPTDYLSCTDCLQPYVTPFENKCYTLTVNWNDGCITSEEICVFVKSCEAVFLENKLNSISPQQISDQAAIELEIARTQFAHIEIVENNEVQFVIWEGFLKAGLRTLNLDFSTVPTGSHELRVRLYPEDQFINIEKI